MSPGPQRRCNATWMILPGASRIMLYYLPFIECRCFGDASGTAGRCHARLLRDALHMFGWCLKQVPALLCRRIASFMCFAWKRAPS